ncbi:MAG: hypothetical protein ACI83B_003443 [Sediminicola sp.]|jgi:hypothetical protein
MKCWELLEVEFDKARALEIGWDQCTAFNADSASELYISIKPEHQDTSGVYLVLSHPCSLLHPSYTVEENLEYILGHATDECLANNMYGKNPRLFDITCSSTNVTYRFNQNYRGFISRQKLGKSNVCSFLLTETNRTDIKRWMSNRYIASALPDKFDLRIGSLRNKLKTLYGKGVGKLCRSVYLLIDEPTKDLHDATSYNISIFYTLSNDSYNLMYNEEDSGNSRFEAFLNKVLELFKKANGIELNKAAFISESHLTLEQLNNSKFIKWNLDYISLGKIDSELAEPIQ